MTNAGASSLRLRGVLGLCLSLLLVALLAAAPAWGAISDSEELASFASEGPAAGQIGAFSSGIAVDPVTGHVYVVDEDNHRLDEFSPWGEFVKAFGWDVAPGGVNEVQEIRIRATAGNFKLTFGGDTTTEIAVNAGASAVANALNALPSIGPAGVTVEERKGDVTGVTPYIYTVTFTGAALEETNVAQLVASEGAPPLSGGTPSSSLLSRARVEGGKQEGTGLEICTVEGGGCRAGLEGSGAGQLSAGIPKPAIDADGDIYLAEQLTHRVQEFGPGGAFLAMFGGGVNHTTGADICTAAEEETGDECGAGSSGTAPGEFEGRMNIAIGPPGEVFVSSPERIQKFSSGGVFESEIPTPGKTVASLEMDEGGNFYVSYRSPTAENEPDVRKLDPTGTEVGTFSAFSPQSISLDPAGNVFVVESANQVAKNAERILEFGQDGSPLSPATCCEPRILPGSTPFENFVERFKLRSQAIGSRGTLYAINAGATGKGASVRSYGPPPISFESPPLQPPTIASEVVSGVGPEAATIKARINPHFWNDTTFFAEVGTEPCSLGGCQALPVPPGEILTTNFVGNAILSAGINFTGLQPNKSYFYRVVAQSTGGGPVTGPEKTFKTPVAAVVEPFCPNAVFRFGFSSALPDCRAYEMVSPVDKEGSDIHAVLTFNSLTTAVDQSAVEGSRLTYTSYKAFGDATSGTIANQYLASRSAGGWATESLSAAHGPTFYNPGNSLESEFKAFTSDLCGAWLVREADPVLAPGAVSGFPNFYSRTNCGGGAGAYQAITTEAPPGVQPHGYFPEPQGGSADGSSIVFSANAKLTPEASSSFTETYLAANGGLSLVCVLPNGLPNNSACSAGTGETGQREVSNNRVSRVHNAISSNGSRLYWTAAVEGSNELGPGHIFLRSNPGEPQSPVSGGTCTEPQLACTVAVSQASALARFWAASPDGSRALFLVEQNGNALDENLYLYNADEGTRTLIAKEVPGVLAASEDLSRIYFASRQVIAGTSGATAGKPNLYLYDSGSYRYIATLSALDVHSTTGLAVPSDVDPRPVYHAANATEDGQVLTFISTAKLTDYDNTDADTGEADSEVYLYSAITGQFSCVSCNPSGGNPVGREFSFPTGGPLPTAAALPLPLTQFHTPAALSSSGERLFFNSYDALVPADTNGNEDVYEWERPGVGTCTEGSGAFSGPNAGCIYLITSGTAASDSEFVDASADGKDAFFTTSQSLLPQDPGLVDIYDARAEGGQPVPPSPGPSCGGEEACQGTASSPSLPSPGTSSKSTGNPAPKKCPKGKHPVTKKGKPQCVKNQKHKQKKHHKSKKKNENKKGGDKNKRAEQVGR